ncbi:hypothetical protein D3C84_412540 [compost metagenome]
MIEVQHRSEAQVQADRQHFGGHQPTAFFGQYLGIGVVGNGTHGRQAHKPLAQSLDAPTFLVHGQDQVRAHGTNGCGQLTHLAWAFDVAGKDDQAGHFGLAQ